MNRRRFLTTSGALAASTLFHPMTAIAQGAVQVGFSVPDTTNPFLGWLTTSVKDLAAQKGITLEIADAGASPVRQMEQIENFIAMGVKVIDIMPVDPNNVQDIIARAQAQGVKILVQGTDTGVYDVMMNIDQRNCGVQIAEMAIAWMVKTFSTDGTEGGLPTGADAPKIVVIPATDTIDAKNRSQGMIDTITAWGKGNLVLSATEARSTAAGTTVMETLWLQNPDTDIVLTYNADTAMGVNEYMMAQAGLDRPKFGVFSGDWSPPVQETIDMSAKDESLFRGTIQIVGPVLDGKQVDLPVATWQVMEALMKGETPWGTWIKDTIAKAGPKAA
ncbi:sugar ABC transporter substrate-binding protein [Rhizobium sp. SL86]|uniref:sugar ABC transporter substrate-binding protein n=1 Tax=Rhizobium sp. SL86 TaxID=2995148 RepID=UPI0022760F86|nr:sugar ABC transporter substrate-binding protein [Rhizobium sp. SL86]MCY1667638.1 sugar ABC transporter substrate-binding protein [Rhizobium sp. SL86]